MENPPMNVAGKEPCTSYCSENTLIWKDFIIAVTDPSTETVFESHGGLGQVVPAFGT